VYVYLKDATLQEFNPDSNTCVISEIPTQNKLIGGTMKLGNYDTIICNNSIAYSIYNKNIITERHRHRYEVDLKYKDILNKHGLHFTGTDNSKTRMNILELCTDTHPFFFATQFHPEFKTRPLEPTPIFSVFIGKCCVGIV
jgi:CTP synthase